MNHGTYTLVDTVAGGNGERNAQVIRTGGATSSTWLTDIRVDQLSIGFDALEFSELRIGSLQAGTFALFLSLSS